MIAIAWALLSGGCAPACGDLAQLEQRECAVEVVIETLDESYPRDFIERKGLDLEALFEQWRALPAAHPEPEDFGAALQEGVAALRDGHTGVIGGVAPLRLNDVRAHEVDGVWIMAHTPLGVPGLQAGDRLHSVGGVPIEEALALETPFGSTPAAQALARLQGAFVPAEESRVLVERGGVVRREDIIGAVFPGAPSSALERVRGAHVLRVADFGQHEDLAWLDARMDEVAQDAEALVIDLRGNGGGYAWVVEGFIGRLFEQAPPDYPILDTWGEPWALRGRVVPRGQIYTGPLAVLVDPDSASASNYLAHRVRQAGRGLVCGAPSGGASGLPRLSVPLAPGLQLISVDLYLVGPDGEDLELGLEPDPGCAVAWTREQLLEGLDSRHGDPATDLALDLALQAVGAP
ncbi:MAG: hypothetical protein H6741_22340 [Alphaproteobacteria bacterium]|nr:hypothetical protein [Alphaproteobacteria bacterium]